MTYHVYILQSLKDNRTYVGFSSDLEKRLARHNAGQVRATKHRRPLQLLFSEELLTAQQAKKRELWWKNGGGRRRLKKLLESNRE